MKEFYKKRQQKWDKLFIKLDKAHIRGLEKLANEVLKGDLDYKELRANIALFKAEKGEVIDYKEPEEGLKLKQRLLDFKKENKI